MEAIERLEKIEKFATAILEIGRSGATGVKANDIQRYAETILQLAQADKSFLKANIRRIEKDLASLER